MALPFDPAVSYKSTKKTSGKVAKVAVRMDLVALEKINGKWTIVFWEAKLASNPQVRCNGDELPHVHRQLANYEAWITRHRDKVIAEYRSNCKILVKMQKHAQTIKPEMEPLGEGIVAVAGSAQLDLDIRPRLIIDRQKANPSFEKHLEKLRRAGTHVQVVEQGGSFVLEANK